MEEIIFHSFNNPSLSMETRGFIDQNEMSISVIMPPSLDLAANKLIAESRIRKESKKDSEEFHLLMNRFWNNGDKIAVDRNDFDPQWTGDSSFVNEYTLKIEREFLSRLIQTPPKYSSSPDFNIQLIFNDLAEPVVSTLTEIDFLNGLTGNNFTTNLGDVYSPNLPAASKNYGWTIYAISEGIIEVTFQAGSVYHNTPPLVLNSSSNTLYMVYDATPPVLPGLSTVTVTNLDVLIITDDYNDAVLTLSFNESSDLLTTKKNLLYSFYFSNSAADVTGSPATITANGKELFYPGPLEQKLVPYQTEYTWNFSSMPQELKDMLINGSTLSFNVIVEDLAANSTLYSYGDVFYEGPDYP